MIAWETVAELCPAEATRFQDALDCHDIDEEIFLGSASAEDLAGEILIFSERHQDEAVQEDAWQAASEIFAAWKALQKAFADATRVGSESFLTLGTDYADAEAEDGEVCYTVEGAYQFSPAGRKFNDRLTPHF